MGTGGAGEVPEPVHAQATAVCRASQRHKPGGSGGCGTI